MTRPINKILVPKGGCTPIVSFYVSNTNKTKRQRDLKTPCYGPSAVTQSTYDVDETSPLFDFCYHLGPLPIIESTATSTATQCSLANCALKISSTL